MKRFDYFLMADQVVNVEAEFTNACLGDVDTLPIFKEIHPGMDNYRQQFLFETLWNKKYCAHYALADMLSLQELYTFSNVPHNKIMKSSFSTVYTLMTCYYKEKQHNKEMSVKHAIRGIIIVYGRNVSTDISP
jgi:hypothetical protein